MASGGGGNDFLRNFFWGVGALLGMLYGAFLGTQMDPDGLGGLIGMFVGTFVGAIVGRALDNAIARTVMLAIAVLTFLAERMILSALWHAIAAPFT